MDEAAFRNLISGKTRGPTAALRRSALSAASPFYRAAVALRSAAYDVGLRRAQRAAVPVISVGNITAGGTGKTPFVAHLANSFQAQGVRPALLSRGYRALPGKTNDEKLVLDSVCPGVPHLQDPDRVASAQRAVREHSAQLLILDDGFQHRRLARDLDIVLIDATNPWGYGRLLPRGLLREPVSSLRRADLVVLTRVDQCTPDQRQQILGRLAAIRSGEECVEVAYPPSALVDNAGNTAEVPWLAGHRVLAFCGLGNPDGFRQTLESQGIQIAEFIAFPDHHHYNAKDLTRLAEQARHTGAEALLTTQKDLVKIPLRQLGPIPLWAVRIGLEVVSGKELFESRLRMILAMAAGIS